jgi:hypothetical protein
MDEFGIVNAYKSGADTVGLGDTGASEPFDGEGIKSAGFSETIIPARPCINSYKILVECSLAS